MASKGQMRVGCIAEVAVGVLCVHSPVPDPSGLASGREELRDGVDVGHMVAIRSSVRKGRVGLPSQEPASVLRRENGRREAQRLEALHPVLDIEVRWLE